jgi:hypothetical protein
VAFGLADTNKHVVGLRDSAPTRDDDGQSRRGYPWWTWVLGVLALLSRLLFTSAPYFVDGPRHEIAVRLGGTIFVHSPPGYFLFGETAKIISQILHVSAGSALSILNVSFSSLGVVVFANLSRRMFPGSLGAWLAVCYAFSDMVWFVADIHSTYAAMTFFAPALLYMLWFDESGWLAGLVWAAMTGFRPSDGLFVLPFVIFVMGRRSLRQMVFFAVTALPLVALWYVPTLRHFGGDLLSPLRAAGAQAHYLANGLLVNAPWKRRIGNLVHLAFGCFNAWNVLTFFVVAGCFSRERWTLSALIYFAPGLLFFVLYFFSDPAYFAYLIAPGFLLAGAGLQRMRPRYAVIFCSFALLISVLQMMVARPIRSASFAGAVINSYCLKYSGWAIRHQYDPRLRDVLDAMPKQSD